MRAKPEQLKFRAYLKKVFFIKGTPDNHISAKEKRAINTEDEQYDEALFYYNTTTRWRTN